MDSGNNCWSALVYSIDFYLTVQIFVTCHLKTILYLFFVLIHMNVGWKEGEGKKENKPKNQNQTAMSCHSQPKKLPEN